MPLPRLLLVCPLLAAALLACRASPPTGAARSEPVVIASASTAGAAPASAGPASARAQGPDEQEIIQACRSKTLFTPDQEQKLQRLEQSEQPEQRQEAYEVRHALVRMWQQRCSALQAAGKL